MLALVHLASIARYTVCTLYLVIATSFATECCALNITEKTNTNTSDADKLKVELLADVSSIKPNSTFQLGIYIRHFKELPNEDGKSLRYHTYWKNPGVVGVPTNVKWNLPKGFIISKPSWPYPELTKMINIPCYGYERDIMITYTVTVPENLTQKTIKISGDASWMCCATKCYPGYSTLSLTLPVTEKLKPKINSQLFEKAQAELPKSEHSIKASLLSAPDAEQILVHLKSSESFTPIHLFNSDGQMSPDQNYTMKKQADNSWIYTAQRPDHSPKGKKEFPMVLQTKTGYYELNALIKEGK